MQEALASEELNFGVIVRLIFPASYLSNQLSMTGLLVMLGLGGNPQMAADVGIVQGAALALFFSFSGNARNLILKSGDFAPVREIALIRLILVLPLSIGVYCLGTLLGGVAWELTTVLILRKVGEWFSEIHLGEAERNHDAKFAFRHLLIQSLLLAIVAILIATDVQGFLFGLVLWSLIPLLASLRYFQALLSRAGKLVTFGMMLPHFGSSAVTGIGFYAFRLAILLLAGKIIAGDLYTAFAIGGLLGSLFALGLGPSLVLHEQNSGRRVLPAWLVGALCLASLTGVIVTVAAHLQPDYMLFVGKSMLFWQALGFSLIGGVVMVFAHRQRLRDLQHGSREDVFAPDVLVNMLVVMVVPVNFFIFGLHGLAWLYVTNATMALIFYWMADKDRATLITGKRVEAKLGVVIAMMLVMPLFLTLDHGVFRSEDFLYSSAGFLTKLPVPVSVFSCYLGLVLLGNFRRANYALTAIFLFFVLMILATVATTSGSPSDEKSKLLLLLQYILPTFGLALGMMYEEVRGSELLVAKSMLVVIAVLMPVQLLASWAQGAPLLTPYIYIFSIYQYLEYVPVVVASCFILGLFSLWNSNWWRMLIILLTPVFGTYVVVSGSMLTIGYSLVGCVVFSLFHGRQNRVKGQHLERKLDGKAYVLVLSLAVVLAIWVFREFSLREVGDQIDVGTASITATGLSITNPDRIGIWSHYFLRLFDDPTAFLFGHKSPPERSIWPSAYNYYLDAAYNFGVLATFAFLGLVATTIIKLYKYRERVLACSATTGMMIVVLFLILPYSLTSVSMRQPYSGIFTFFLWGLLLARIEQVGNTDLGKRLVATEPANKFSLSETLRIES